MSAFAIEPTERDAVTYRRGVTKGVETSASTAGVPLVAEFEIVVRSVEAECRVVVKGEIDIATSSALERALDDLLPTTPDLVLDLRAVRFIDSSGVRTLLRADRTSRAAGGRIRLVPGPPGVQRVFAVLGVAERLEFIEAEPGE